MSRWRRADPMVPGTIGETLARFGAADRFGNRMAPELHAMTIAVIGLHRGLVATELVAIWVKEAGLDDGVALPMTVPARMIVYFAACEAPSEHVGRLFWPEREMTAPGVAPDGALTKRARHCRPRCDRSA